MGKIAPRGVRSMIRAPQAVIAAALALSAHSVSANAREDWELASDVGLGSLVLWSLGVPAIEGDEQGVFQAGLSVGAGYGGAQALKLAFPRQRPDGDGNDSFPSGHTSTAFAAATSILERRGPEEGIPAFIVAGFVGTARVEAGRHRWSEIAAGAALGTLSGLLLTSKKKDAPTVAVWGDGGGLGVTYAARF